MYIKKIKFTDFLNNVREEEYRFNLTEAELLDWEAKTDGGLRNLLERLEQRQSIPDLTRFFTDFIKASYGEVSPDGVTFDKNDEIWNRFYRSNAYNEFYMELVSDDNAALDFINGVIPKTKKEAGDDTKLRLMQEARAKAEQNVKATL